MADSSVSLLHSSRRLTRVIENNTAITVRSCARDRTRGLASALGAQEERRVQHRRDVVTAGKVQSAGRLLRASRFRLGYLSHRRFL